MRRAAVQSAYWCAVLAVLASCTTHSGYYSSDNNNTPSGPTGPTGSTGPTTGTVVGTITTSLGGPLAGVHVVVTPAGGSAMAAITTSNSGGFVATNVPTSTTGGAVTVSALPGNCPTTSASNYTGLKSGDTVTVNITVVCSTLVGTVKGTVTNSLGGGLAGAGVVVTPHGGTALAAVATSTSGAFVVANVPIADSTGAVAVTSVPAGCTVPASATSYTKLGYGDTVTVPITVTCTNPGSPTGTVSGTVTSSLSGRLGGVQVVVTPTGGTALPAVTTTGAGVYSVSNVPVGAGAVTITGGLPGQCAAPSAVAYTGLAKNGTATANLVATCQQLGTLTVTITPSPTLGSVTVTGPGGYSQSITQTTALTGLVPGSYTVVAAPYEIPQAFVGVMYDGAVTGSPATVGAGGTSNVSVSYGIRGGTGALWAFGGNAYYQIPNAQLATNGTATTLFGTPNGGMAIGSALVDRNGTLWLVGTNYNCGGFCPPPPAWPGIFGCTPSDLAAGHLTTCSDSLALPTLGILSTPIQSAPAAAFDAAGNMWFVGYEPLGGGPETLDELTPAQLAAGGTQSPVISFTIGSFESPTAMAIDPHGTLWLGGTGGYFGNIEGYSLAQIVAGASPAPVSIPMHAYVSGMAFDQSGNLWISQYDSSRVVMLTPSQLAAGGSQTPTVILTSVAAPTGLAFDASGDLWVIGTTAQRLFGFSAFQLTTSGAPTPQISIAFSTSSYPGVLAFDPHSLSLPLNGSRVAARRPKSVMLRAPHKH